MYIMKVKVQKPTLILMFDFYIHDVSYTTRARWHSGHIKAR